MHSLQEPQFEDWPDTPEDEQKRLSSLDEYDILDTPNEEIFDRITRMACRLLHIETSTITFVDGHRQWFKSCLNLEDNETPREPSFCRYAIRSHKALVVPDTLADERFKTNVFVIGAPFIRSYAGIPLAPNNGVALGTLCVIGREPRIFAPAQIDILRDLASLAEAALELRKLATLDGLTGCQSRRAFGERFRQTLLLSARHLHDVSLVVFDIDHFKRINDTFGHGAGDDVLRAVSDLCRRILRVSDFIGRLGGEEFAIALPHTDRAGAIKVAELLRSAIETAPFEADRKQIRITASFGVATCRLESDTAEAIFSRADEALYQAKRSGRNQTIASSDRAISEDTDRRVLKAGLIVFNFGRSTIDCTVRRLSATGAHLQIPPQTSIPETFELWIRADAFSKACRVIERDGAAVVVSIFDSAMVA